MRIALPLVLVLSFLIPSAARGSAEIWGPLRLLDQEIQPGQKHRLVLRVSESFAGHALTTPVLVARGTEAGPTICISAGVHGDELNGVEIARRIYQSTHTRNLRGTVIAVPIMNLHGFRRSSRYLPDRRDLNRYFPGRRDGSSAARIAAALFDGFVQKCDALVDLHTGSFHRTNLPQLRADLRNVAVQDLARGFGALVVVHSVGSRGTLRRAATEAGIPAITYEAGEPMRFQDEEVQRGVRGLRSLLASLGMLKNARTTSSRQDVFLQSLWVRVDEGGILLAHVRLGDNVEADELLGTVTDPITNERSVVRAPREGRIIGMALNQVVIPGFAAFHLGIAEALPAVSTPAPDESEARGEDDSGALSTFQAAPPTRTHPE